GRSRRLDPRELLQLVEQIRMGATAPESHHEKRNRVARPADPGPLLVESLGAGQGHHDRPRTAPEPRISERAGALRSGSDGADSHPGRGNAFELGKWRKR